MLIIHSFIYNLFIIHFFYSPNNQSLNLSYLYFNISHTYTNHKFNRTVSGEVPVEPVISVKTGHLFEKRLIEKYLKAGNKCPISGVELAETDLLHVQGKRRQEEEGKDGGREGGGVKGEKKG